MTTAVCFKCGAFKIGAFVPCSKCGAAPLSEDDMVMSFVVTDHHFDLNALKEIGLRISRGDPPKVDPKTRIDVLQMMRQTGSVFDAMRKTNEKLTTPKPKPADKAASQGKPWWQFWKKQPDEVNAAILELDKIENAFPDFEVDLISTSVRDRIKTEPEKVVHSIRVDGMTPKALVYLVITNVLDRELSSGRFHVYRGLLSGSGENLLRLWDHAVDELLKSGNHSEEDAAKDKKWIREQIRNVG